MYRQQLSHSTPHHHDMRNIAKCINKDESTAVRWTSAKLSVMLKPSWKRPYTCDILRQSINILSYQQGGEQDTHEDKHTNQVGVVLCTMQLLRSPPITNHYSSTLF